MSTRRETLYSMKWISNRDSSRLVDSRVIKRIKRGSNLLLLVYRVNRHGAAIFCLFFLIRVALHWLHIWQSMNRYLIIAQEVHGSSQSKRRRRDFCRNIDGEWKKAVWAGVVGIEQQWLRWSVDCGTIKSTTVSVQWFSWQLKQTNKQTFTVCMFLCVWCGSRDQMLRFDVTIKPNSALFT